MSNPTTNYITNVPNIGYQDLSGIFLPVSAGSSIGYNTGFNVSGYGDFQNIFASISGGQGIGYNTGFKVNGVGDLSTLFAAYTNVVVSGATIQYTTYNNVKYGYVVVPGSAAPTPTNLYGSTFPSPLPNPPPYPTPTQNTFTITPILPNIQINFILVGGGAGGGGGGSNQGTNNGGAGGGGAGGFCQGYFTGNQNSLYFVTVGGGGGGGYFNPSVDTFSTGNPGLFSPGGPGGNSSINVGVGGAYIVVTGGSNYGYSSLFNQSYYNAPWSPATSASGQASGWPYAPAASGSYDPNSNLPPQTTISVAGLGGRGGYGVPNTIQGSYWTYPGNPNIAMLGATPTTSTGSIGSNYSLNYLGNNIYVGGGGTGAYCVNSVNIQAFNFTTPGGAPGGGGGGYPAEGHGTGGDANSIYVGGKGYYGGGGGGAAWGGANSGLRPVGGTGNGGAGAPGVAIIWWEA